MSTSTPFTLQQLTDIANRYAPIVRFHPDEQYFMCSVQWYLDNATLYGPNTKISPPKINQLPTGTDDNGQWWLEMIEAVEPGDLSIARAYVHATWEQGTAYTDIQYWFCYGYNGPGTLHVSTVGSEADISLAPLGEHWVDWELVTIRVRNDTQNVEGVLLSQHGSGEWITDLSHFERYLDQFIVYASKNGHAVYSTPGVHPTHHVNAGLFSFYLRNDTELGKNSFNCSNNFDIVSADFISSITEPQWLHFPYRWGKGDNTSITVNAVAAIIKAAFKPYLWLALLPAAILTSLAVAILPRFRFDNTNGVYGPQTQGYWTDNLIPTLSIDNGYTSFNTNSDSPPCIVAFKNLFHVFFKDHNGKGIMHITSPDGVNWSQPSSWYTGYNTSAGPCAVVFNDTLYVFFRDGNGNGILHIQTTDGDNWSPSPNWYIGLNCDHQPNAAVLDGACLCVSAIDLDGNGIMRSVLTPW